MTGSANHLWFEYVKNSPPAFSNILVVRDLAFLIIFGFFAASICYSSSAQEFILRAIYYLAVAIGWALIDLLIGLLLGYSSGERWRFWFVLNTVQLGVFLIAYLLDYYWEFGNPSFIAWSWSLVILVVSSPIILLVDLFLQLRQVETPNNPQVDEGG